MVVARCTSPDLGLLGFSQPGRAAVLLDPYREEDRIAAHEGRIGIIRRRRQRMRSINSYFVQADAQLGSDFLH